MNGRSSCIKWKVLLSERAAVEGPFLRREGPADMKIRRRAVGGRRAVVRAAGVRPEGTRRLYLGHPGRHSPRSIAVPARAALSLAPSALTVT